MHKDAEFKKEQVGSSFVWVGALEGGFGGRVVPQGCPPQKVNRLPKKIKKINTLLWPLSHNIKLPAINSKLAVHILHYITLVA
jgi:hypothetical protein